MLTALPKFVRAASLLGDYSVTPPTRPDVYFSTHQPMQNVYRIFCRRSGVFYLEHIQTGQQTSLKTRDQAYAERLLNAKDIASEQPTLNLAIARVHPAAHDPKTGFTDLGDKIVDRRGSHFFVSSQNQVLTVTRLQQLV